MIGPTDYYNVIRTMPDGTFIHMMDGDQDPGATASTVCIKVTDCTDGYEFSKDATTDNTHTTHREIRCVDIDECETDPDTCDDNFECYNTPGSYLCICDPEKFTLTDVGCIDIDECVIGTHTCHNYGTCTNTIGGYECDGEFTCDHRVFKVHWSEARDYEAAKSYCNDVMMMELPTPRSINEVECLKQIADGEFWLGIINQSRTGFTESYNHHHDNPGNRHLLQNENRWYNEYRNEYSQLYANWATGSPATNDWIWNGYIRNHNGVDRDYARTLRNGQWVSERGLHPFVNGNNQLDNVADQWVPTKYTTVCIKLGESYLSI